jgi:hypothetical protein
MREDDECLVRLDGRMLRPRQAGVYRFHELDCPSNVEFFDESTKRWVPARVYLYDGYPEIAASGLPSSPWSYYVSPSGEGACRKISGALLRPRWKPKARRQFSPGQAIDFYDIEIGAWVPAVVHSVF